MNLSENQYNGFLDNFTLKMIAILTMIIDHVGYVLFPEMTILRAIGRVSFPIFCFLIVEGFHHTRSHLNYLTRLLIFAILSEIPFDLAFHGGVCNWQYQNVFFTLAFGLMALFCLEEMNSNKIYAIGLILVIAATYFSKCDYGVGGVLLICMFYLAKNNLIIKWILCALILYLYFGTFELYGLIAMIPISLYNGKRGPKSAMFFYWFYPVHLLILFAIAYFLKS